MEPVIIIGAGPAGLTAGLSLARNGREVILIEKSSRVGGLTQSFELWGQIVDLGPHRFFSKNNRVEQFWLSACGDAYNWVPRQTRIYYNSKFFDYPLKPLDALVKLGPGEGLSCILSYFRQRISRESKEDTFESWVTSQFGRRLFEVFFKTYTEKLWGIPCNQIHSDFAAQRIKSLSLMSALLGSLSPKSPRTLIKSFRYPKRGAGYPYLNMEKELVALGGSVYLNQSCEGIEYSNSGVTVTTQSASYAGSHVISTMPLSLSCMLLSPTQEVQDAISKLTYRNTVLVYLEVVGENPFRDNWMYIHSSKLETGRITNFSNWGMRGNGGNRHILCLEYWCQSDDSVWSFSDEDWELMARRDIQESSLLDRHEIANCKVVRIPQSYPVYKTDYMHHIDVIKGFLNALDWFTPIGRSGSFKYNNQDHSIYMGLLAADNLLVGANNDLWSVNSDVEYQESAKA